MGNGLSAFLFPYIWLSFAQTFVNCAERGFEIITVIQILLEKHFSQGISPCKPCFKVSEDLRVLECLSTHTQKYTSQKTDKADD